MKVNKVEHPLLDVKISLLRNVETDSKSFRDILEEVSTFLAYEALKDIKVKEIKINTPVKKNATGYSLDEKVIIVPIFRAGLGMVNGVTSLFPQIKVGHIGIYRDDNTNKTSIYYNKLPKSIKGAKVLVLDPMLATGSTIIDSINLIKESGPSSISVLSVVAAPEGIKKLESVHPDVELVVGSIDEKLDKNGYISPGLGDAGDRIFGTK